MRVVLSENTSKIGCEPCTVNIGCVEPDPMTVKIAPDIAVLNDPDKRVVPAT
jgi:hypothetical protein